MLAKAPAAVRAIGGGSVGGATQTILTNDGTPSIGALGRGTVLGGLGGAGGDFVRGPDSADTLAREALAASGLSNAADWFINKPPSIGEASCGS
jgi:hypothetical protein